MSRRSDKARELRHEPSRAERLCWEQIRGHRMEGAKFRRQHPIGPYFADFACVSRRLVIEIDGDHHADRVESDLRRTAFMEGQGWRVVRFGARDVVESPEGIWAAIQAEISEGTSPPLLTSPPSGGEEHEGGGPIRGQGHGRAP
ncbi:endonuclease domain-containing protein [Reyranella sp.]|uniref:endonuclease domain-containing protein n=1 Tax=Reyranella sp. TaxID=1929291 RepID=UPI003BAAB782